MTSARVVVVETVYFQSPVDAAVAVETRYSKECGEEQPYSRRRPVGAEWVDIDSGWLSEACLMVVQNVGDGPLEVGFMGFPLFNVEPGESLRGEPSNIKNFQMRGGTTAVVTLLPR